MTTEILTRSNTPETEVIIIPRINNPIITINHFSNMVHDLILNDSHDFLTNYIEKYFNELDEEEKISFAKITKLEFNSKNIATSYLRKNFSPSKALYEAECYKKIQNLDESLKKIAVKYLKLNTFHSISLENALSMGEILKLTKWEVLQAKTIIRNWYSETYALNRLLNN